jgi:hypothetical protein
VSGYVLWRQLRDGFFRFTGTGRLEIEQMPLALAFDDPFTLPAIDPSFQTIEFFDRGLKRLLQLLVGGRRFIEDAVEFCHLPLGIGHLTLTLSGLLESGQQETLALGKIIGKLRGVVHNAPCCTNSLD